MKILSRFAILSVVIAILSGCGKKDETAYMTSKEHFTYAMKFFKKGNYTKAQEQFQILTFKYSGSDIADDAQFYLAESYFQQKDHVSAASEYDRLVTSYPRSEFVEESMYKLAMCYFELSPGYELDQKFTYDALSATQNFLDLYPKSGRKSEMDSLYMLISDKLARKEFENASTYRKVTEYEAAIVYYDIVINDYHTSQYAGQALYWKAYCYSKLKLYEKARLILQKVLDQYPLDKKLVNKTLELIEDVRNKEAKAQTARQQDSK
jgi:outer membrane protein assembly factor BamD